MKIILAFATNKISREAVLGPLTRDGVRRKLTIFPQSDYPSPGEILGIRRERTIIGLVSEQPGLTISTRTRKKRDSKRLVFGHLGTMQEYISSRNH